MLKSLFGKVTFADLHLLDYILDRLQSSTSNIFHYLTPDVTYVKKLDMVARINEIPLQIYPLYSWIM